MSGGGDALQCTPPARRGRFSHGSCCNGTESEAAFSKAWGLPVTWGSIEEGEWTATLSDTARADLQAFSTVMIDQLFTTLSQACRAVDPNHLNLGARYYTAPPDWALAGMRSFDVFSVNCYREQPDPALKELSERVGRPVLIGEWHFGALDVGLPASGIGRVDNQVDRGKAFRVYLEDAAAQPWCVGAHYFTLYDQSALGRFDGECYNIGFLDVCNRPYEPTCNGGPRPRTSGCIRWRGARSSRIVTSRCICRSCSRRPFVGARSSGRPSTEMAGRPAGFPPARQESSIGHQHRPRRLPRSSGCRKRRRGLRGVAAVGPGVDRNSEADRSPRDVLARRPGTAFHP